MKRSKVLITGKPPTIEEVAKLFKLKDKEVQEITQIVNKLFMEKK